MLSNSVSQAEVAGKKISLSLSKQIAVLETANVQAGSQNAMAVAERLKIARLELAKDAAIQELAIKRASGVQLSLAESLRLKAAGLEYRSLTTVAAEAERFKVASNQKAMSDIVAQESSAAQAEAAIEDVRTNEHIAAIQARKLADAEAVEASIRDTTGALEWALIEDEERTRVAAEEAAKRIAIAKAEELATIATTVKSGTISGVGHGSITGIIRETLVIIREISMGRGFGRIGGSLTLLAQYLGVLKLAVRSTATEFILAAIAQDKLAVSAGREALIAEARTARIRESILATGTEAEMTAFNTSALVKETEALRADAIAQGLRAKEMNLAKDVQVAGAVAELNPVFFGVIAAVTILGVAVYATWKHFHRLSEDAKNLTEMMNPLKRKFTEEADELREDAKEHQAYLDWLKKIGEMHETLPEKIDKTLQKMREVAKAEEEIARQRGASALQIEGMEENELAAELAVTNAALAQANQESATAKSAADAADAAFTNNPVNSEGVDLHGAERVAKNSGEILDAAQDNMESYASMRDLLAAQRRGLGNTTIGKPGGGGQVGLTAQGAVEAGLGGVTPTMTVNEAITKLTVEYSTAEKAIKVGNKEVIISVNEAKDAYTKSTETVDALQKVQKELADTLADTKTTYEEKRKAVLKLTEKAQSLQEELGIKQQYGRQEAVGEHKGTHNDVTERERIGLGASSSVQLSMLQVGLRSENHLAEISADIKYMKNNNNDGAFE